MKWLSLLIIPFFLSTSHLRADEVAIVEPSIVKAWYTTLEPEARMSFFHFSNITTNSLYGDGCLNIQVGTTHPFYNDCKIWVSVSTLMVEGRSLTLETLTTLDVTPINIGIRCGDMGLPFGGIGYVQAGPTYYHMSTRNAVDFMRKTFHRNGVGVFFGGGGQWNVSEHLYLDLFIEYSHRWTNHIRSTETATRRRFNINGWDFGGGFAYKF
jgi:hypothetical protein